jgi:hypothetical protein
MKDLDKQADSLRGSSLAASHAASLIEHIARDADRSASNYDAMIERIARAGQASKPCGSCRGKGYRAVPKVTLERYARKIGRSPDPNARERLRGELRALSQCQKCQGTGARASESRATMCDACDATGRRTNGSTCKACRGLGVLFLGDFDDFSTTARCARCHGSAEVFDEEEQDVCPVCRGASYTIPTTVKEKGSSKKGKVPHGTESADDQQTGGASGKAIGEDLDEAVVLEGKIERENPRAIEALKLYHGPVGDRWGAQRWGRLFALWPVTAAGRRVLADAAKNIPMGGGLLRDPHEFLSELREAEDKNETPNAPLRAQFGQADREARALLKEAGRVVEAARTA